MKKTTIFLFALSGIVFFGCSSQNKEEDHETIEVLIEDDLATEEHKHMRSDKQEGFEHLIAFKDEYPAEVGLFQDVQLTSRLANLLGSDFNDFQKLWEVETPILIEENILFTTGCEQHNCFANQFILIIDLKNDNINVYRLGLTSADYEEKGTIRLPKGIEAEFGAMMDSVL